MYLVPKRDLIVGLQVMLQAGELQIAEGMPGTAELLAEMASMRVRITDSGREQFGAWREGAHDDLVLAVALACWGVRRDFPGRDPGHWAGPEPGLYEALCSCWG
jgi:hypothetical protein